MHLHDLMGWPGPMTHRQFLAWQMWQRIMTGDEEVVTKPKPISKQDRLERAASMKSIVSAATGSKWN